MRQRNDFCQTEVLNIYTKNKPRVNTFKKIYIYDVITAKQNLITQLGMESK